MLIRAGYDIAFATDQPVPMLANLSVHSSRNKDLRTAQRIMTQPDVPVIAVVGGGPAGASMQDVVTRLGERKADLVTVGPAGTIRTPAVDERYAPLLDILPMQRLALALALHRGEDPDAPRSLKKVTTTL